uniref:Uncharacterized protein n=1 Tax=Helianthus annuus TaxID=4232 RepID=A0A251UTS6_HELAN
MAQMRGSTGKLPSVTAVNLKHQGSSSRNTGNVGKMSIRDVKDIRPYVDNCRDKRRSQLC